jgi:hypothetical protein
LPCFDLIEENIEVSHIYLVVKIKEGREGMEKLLQENRLMHKIIDIKTRTAFRSTTVSEK